MGKLDKIAQGALAAGAVIAATVAAPHLLPQKNGEPTHDTGKKKEAERGKEKMAPNSIDTSQNLISQKELDQHRDAAIKSLLSGLPNDPVVDHLRDDAERLRAESQTYLPSEKERSSVVARSGKTLTDLVARMSPGGYGIFGFADLDQNSEEQHRVYILHKSPSGVAQFVKAYRVTMAEKGFGNGKNSYQTPIGQQEFQSKFEGVYGQVVVAKKDHPKLKYFKREYVGGGVVRRFVSDFGHQTVDEPATVVTDRYTINEERGVHFHASNRTGRWHRRGNRKVWVSFLTPRERSTDGCIRMANADVRDMGRRYIKMRVVRDGKVIEPGTPVAIYATPEVMARHAQ